MLIKIKCVCERERETERQREKYLMPQEHFGSVMEVQINKCHKGSLCNDNHLYGGNAREGVLPGERARHSSETERVMFK